MRSLGVVLLGAGFLIAAFGLVRERESVTWALYGAGLTISVLGIGLQKIVRYAQGHDEEVLLANMTVLINALEQLHTKLHALVRKRRELDVYEVSARIDRDLLPDINEFVAARETVIHKYGLAAFARMMDPFASAERALNRAWSASADGYVDEVFLSLERAERLIERALVAVRSVHFTETPLDEEK